MALDSRQQEQCSEAPAAYDDLSAIYVNCTLKRSPETSHTEGLMRIPMQIHEAIGISVEYVRAVDHVIQPGVQPDMTEHGFDEDEWPALLERVLAADILVLGTPIWLGERSSIASRVIERLYSASGMTNDKGQFLYYGRTGGVVITGNEDGVKHNAMSILYALQHLGYVVPPQADAGWIGPVGPGPSYLDEDSGGPESDFTNRNATFMAWNLAHTARMLKDAGGLPAHGNVGAEWDAGCSLEFPNPEYR